MSIKTLTSVAEFSPLYDIVIIGAGPAGLCAAIKASAAGACVLLLDENPSVGGQIYRAITRITPKSHGFLGADYWQGREIAEKFAATDADYAPGTTVWSIERTGDGEAPVVPVIGLSMHGAARMISAKKIILATGALERPMPVPGWTLPGVMSVGAGQIALKSAGIVPQGRLVLAGSGPLLYLFAAQLLDAGVSITALLDTTPRKNWKRALPYLAGFLGSPYLAKGLTLLLKVRRKIQVVSNVSSLRIDGQGKAQSITFSRGDHEQKLDVDCVLLHQGVIPNINLTSASDCTIEWNEAQRCFQPQLDRYSRTNHLEILIAGDGSGIGGAQYAAVSGSLAAISALSDLSLLKPEQVEADRALLNRERRRYLRGRHFLDALYTPAKAFRAPVDPDTIICRCEEISAGTLRDVIAMDVAGPNQLKTFVRCGMGPCQGRLCAQSVTEIIADTKGISPAEVGTYRLRAPIKPVPLREIAALPQQCAAVVAVTGSLPDDAQPSPH